MKLSRQMLSAFAKIVRGTNTLQSLASSMGKSRNRIAEIVRDLEREEFIAKKSNYSVKGSRKTIEIAKTYHAIKLKELFFEYPGISFEEILTDGRLLFLAAISEDWTDIKTITKLSGISKHLIERYRPKLKNRGVILKKGVLYKINEATWPLLKEFIIAYRNYSPVRGNVKWKYEEETLFAVNDEKLIQGAVTGLYQYRDYGVWVGVISALCYLPKKKLSIEEVFVHSLFEVHDSRTLHLALTFYLKNKLSHVKVFPLAMRYGKYTMFENFAKLLKTKEEKVKPEKLPVFNRKDFIRIANMYGVKNVH